MSSNNRNRRWAGTAVAAALIGLAPVAAADPEPLEDLLGDYGSNTWTVSADNWLDTNDPSLAASLDTSVIDFKGDGIPPHLRTSSRSSTRARSAPNSPVPLSMSTGTSLSPTLAALPCSAITRCTPAGWSRRWAPDSWTRSSGAKQSCCRRCCSSSGWLAGETRDHHRPAHRPRLPGTTTGQVQEEISVEEEPLIIRREVPRPIRLACPRTRRVRPCLTWLSSPGLRRASR
jgi:hypothetical protein